MSRCRADHAPAWLRVIDGGLQPRRDPVVRLRQFQGDHPGIQFISPVTGRFTALIPPGTIPGEDREITARALDLCGLMDQLDDLFRPPLEGPGRESGTRQERNLTQP
jgi:hypothetical protein